MPEPDVIPTSASIASTGLGIRYIGNYAYAYSGQFDASTSSQALLSFTTGAGIIVGEIQISGPLDFDAPNDGRVCNTTVAFNGEIIAILHNDPAAAIKFNDNQIRVTIPPLTNVTINNIANDNDANFQISAVFTGRVYGAE